MGQDRQVEALESRSVIEVPQVGKLVAERVHQARVPERAAGHRVHEADPDRPVRVADAVAPLHARALGFDGPIAESEACGEQGRVAIESLDQLPSGRAVHGVGGSVSATGRTVKYAVPVSVRRLPLFPLASVVLFPDSVVPLHVFEPRYRQLTSDVLAGDRLIGMIAVRPGHEHEMAGDPALYSIGCAGFVTDHRKLADGRFHILLRGTSRFRILEEPPRPAERLYRVAEVNELEDEIGDPEQVEELRTRVIEQLAEVARRSFGEAASSFDPSRLGGLELRRFVGGVCQAVGLPTPEKQSLLESGDLAERLLRLQSALAFHLSARADLAGGGTVH